MADERKEDSSSDEQEERRRIRKDLRDAHEDMQENRRQMADLHSNKFDNVLENLQKVGVNVTKTRELQLHASCLKDVTAALKAQATSLCDMSGRFNWQDLSGSAKDQYRYPAGAIGFNWEKFGCEARIMINCIPSFNTMAGPIYKEEKIRKISVRRQREDTSGVENVTGQVIENHEEDGNDEATNARVAHLLKYLESLKGEPFDLLKILVDPSNPVQSVENFFDFSYLHKEKRVIHDVDEETGTLKAKLVDEELENKKKSQMVLSFSMGEMEKMGHLLFPDFFEENGTTNERASSSSSSSSSNHSSSSSSNGSSSSKRAVPNPLHREDPLYDAGSAAEQVKILQERSAKQAAEANSNNKKKASGSSASSQPTPQTAAAGSSSSRRASNSSSAPAGRGGRSQPAPAPVPARSANPAASSSSSSRPAAAASSRTSSRGTSKRQARRGTQRSEGSDDDNDGEEDEEEEEEVFRSAASRRSRGGGIVPAPAPAAPSRASARAAAPVPSSSASRGAAARSSRTQEDSPVASPSSAGAGAGAGSASRHTRSSPISVPSAGARSAAVPEGDMFSPVRAPGNSNVNSGNKLRSPSFSGTPAKSAQQHATSATTPASASTAISADSNHHTAKNVGVVSALVMNGSGKRVRSEPQHGKENNAYSPELPAGVDMFPSTDSQGSSGSGSSKSDATPIGRKSRRIV